VLAVVGALAGGVHSRFAWTHRATATTLSTEDIPRLQKAAEEVLSQPARFVRRVVTLEEARDMFATNPFKLHFIERVQSRHTAFIGGRCPYAYYCTGGSCR
jgi:threonyl-tRNA synthetase